MKKFIPFIVFIVFIVFISCSDNSKNKISVPSIIELADSYYERTLETFPENAYYADIELAKHNGISSNELSELAKWEHYEDSLYVELSKLKAPHNHFFLTVCRLTPISDLSYNLI